MATVYKILLGIINYLLYYLNMKYVKTEYNIDFDEKKKK
jgi:hypothetical protein